MVGNLWETSLKNLWSQTQSFNLQNIDEELLWIAVKSCELANPPNHNVTLIHNGEIVFYETYWSIRRINIASVQTLLWDTMDRIITSQARENLTYPPPQEPLEKCRVIMLVILTMLLTQQVWISANRLRPEMIQDMSYGVTAPSLSAKGSVVHPW